MEEISTKESGIKVCIRARPTLKRLVYLHCKI